MRTPLVIIAVLVVLLVGVAVVTGSGPSSGGGSAAQGGGSPRIAPVAVIARRVERLRHLRYRRLPVPERVSAATAKRDGLADFDSSSSRRGLLGEEETLELLGLLPPRTSLRAAEGSLFGQGVAGYYDPRSKRLKIVSGAGTSTRVLAETTLAHELTHALEDQRFGLLDQNPGAGSDDASLARLALVEGSATEIMQRYDLRYFSSGELLAGTIGSAFAGDGNLPPFLEQQTLFPYLTGQQFIEYLLARAGGRWDLVNLAERLRPPISTEQVMHPATYLAADAPLHVRLGGVRRALGRGWTRTLSGTFGEFQTRELLSPAVGPDASVAAAGWGGDRWELWRSAPLGSGSCAAPCRADDVLVMRWRWDTPRDEAQFARALRRWTALAHGAVAMTRRAGAVTLALAPARALALRAARAR
jgi:hypothetical protein